MKRVFKCSLIIVSMAVVMAVFLPIRTTAQEVAAPKRSISIAPITFEYQIDPGDNRQGMLRVRNGGQDFLQVNMYSETFRVRGEDYGDYEFVGADPTNAGGWLGFSPSEFNIAPGQELEVAFTVLPPLQAAAGGHYAVMFADASGVNEQAVNIAQRAGALVFTQVNGELQKFGGVASFRTKFWQPSSPLKSELRLQNEGNTHWRAIGEVTYQNILGLAVYRSPVNGLVLPQTIRRFSLEQKPPVLVPGLYIVSGKVNVFDESVKLAPRLMLVLPPLYIAGVGLLLAGFTYWKWRTKYSKRRPHPRRVY